MYTVPKAIKLIINLIFRRRHFRTLLSTAVLSRSPYDMTSKSVRICWSESHRGDNPLFEKNSQKEKNSLVENHASSVGVHSSSIELKIATIGRETQSLELINLPPFTSKTKMDEGLNIFS